MMIKPKGSLMLELLIAMLISGIAISMAMKFPVTLIRMWKKISVKTSGDIDICKIKKLIDDDFSTIFNPDKYNKKPKFELETTGTNSQVQAAGQDAAKDLGADKSPAKFVNLCVKSGRFDHLFFCCTNPIETYSQASPKAVGVVYRLEKKEPLFSESQTSDQSAESYEFSRYETKKVYFSENEGDVSSGAGNEIDFSKLGQKKIVLFKNLEAFEIEFFIFQKKKSDTEEDSIGVLKLSSKENVEEFDEKKHKNSKESHEAIQAKRSIPVYSDEKINEKQGNPLPFKIVLKFKFSESSMSKPLILEIKLLTSN